MEPRAFIRRRFRGKLTEKSSDDHWAGGKAYHRGARCPVCKIPLLLLWDINCKDSRFPRGKFGPLKRLPLYFCWSCVGDISYQVVNEQEIKVHSGWRREGPSSQYDPYPEYFERRGLSLFEGTPSKIWRIIKRMVKRWDSAKDDDRVPVPDKDEQEELTQFFGHRVPHFMCLFHHQLGGKPLHGSWAVEVFQCPNPKCRGSLADRMRKRKRAMKFLAGILNDPWAGLPMVEPANDETKRQWNYHVSVQFHICDCCWTVLGCNRSD